MKLELSDLELLEKARQWERRLRMSGGREWSLQVPISPDDPDVVFSNLFERFAAYAQQPAQGEGAILLKEAGRIIKQAMAIQDCWMPGPYVPPQHEDEAQAVGQMQYEFADWLNDYDKFASTTPPAAGGSAETLLKQLARKMKVSVDFSNNQYNGDKESPMDLEAFVIYISEKLLLPAAGGEREKVCEHNWEWKADGHKAEFYECTICGEIEKA